MMGLLRRQASRLKIKNKTPNAFRRWVFLIEYFVLATSYFPLQKSIIASRELNFCVRNENRCDLSDESPEQNIQYDLI